LGNLTRSPLEIFLTALAVFGFSAGLTYHLGAKGSARLIGRNSESRWTLGGLLIIIPPVLTAAAAVFIERLAAHSNVHLLRFIPSVPFFLLQASIFLIIGAAVVPSFFLLKKLLRQRRRAIPAAFVLAAAAFLVHLLFRPDSGLKGLFPAVGLGLAAAVFGCPPSIRRRIGAGLAMIAATFGAFALIRMETDQKARSLSEGYLRETIRTRDFWAGFLLDESMKTLNRSRGRIVRFLGEPSESADLARWLWSETLAARFNWYSGLEILDPEGTILSRFALNVPKIFSPAADLPLRPEGGIVRLPLPFMGKQKEFLVGYRDWQDGGRWLGRTLLYVSLDDDLLPFSIQQIRISSFSAPTPCRRSFSSISVSPSSTLTDGSFSIPTICPPDSPIPCSPARN
jgi:hypothetical protein